MGGGIKKEGWWSDRIGKRGRKRRQTLYRNSTLFYILKGLWSVWWWWGEGRCRMGVMFACVFTNGLQKDERIGI